jgi:hypothetical protein
VEAAFDPYRKELYEQVRWPLPTTPHEEQLLGRQISTYLLRGSDANTPVFVSAKAPGIVAHEAAATGPSPTRGDGPPGSGVLEVDGGNQGGVAADQRSMA